MAQIGAKPYTGSDAIAVELPPAANTVATSALQTALNTLVTTLNTATAAIQTSNAAIQTAVQDTTTPSPVTFTTAGDAAPASTGAAITPSDTATLTGVRSIYVGGTGNVVATVGGTDLTFTGVPAGFILPIKATKVKATNTTATNMVWLG